MLKNPEAYTEMTKHNLKHYFKAQGFTPDIAQALTVITSDELCDYAGTLGLDEEQGTVLAFRIAKRRAAELV